MAYLENRTFRQRLAGLGTAGAIELLIGAALIAGLSVTVVPDQQAPQLEARNIPVPDPAPPEPRPSSAAADSVITAPEPPVVLDDTPTVLPTPTIDPTVPPPPFDGFTATPRPTPAPSPRFPPAAAAPRNDPSVWVTPNDYPARDLREGHQGTTRFRAIVGSDGRVKSCDVVQSSGFPALDKAVCANVTRRARFEPATDETGARVVGSYTSSVRWQIPG